MRLTKQEYEAAADAVGSVVVCDRHTADSLHFSERCNALTGKPTKRKDAAVYPFGSKPVCQTCFERLESGRLRDESGRFVTLSV